jgi:hypothetical protein
VTNSHASLMTNRCGMLLKLFLPLLMLISGDLWASGWPPFARDDEATVRRGGTVSVLSNGSKSVLDNDIDIEGDTLSAILTHKAKHGDLVLESDGTFSYRHDGSSKNRDEFKYRAFDGTGYSREKKVRIDITESAPVPPKIVGQRDIEIDEDSSREIRFADLQVVDSNDKYPRGFTLNVSDGDGYTRSGVVITPLSDFNGRLYVPVRVFDGSNFSNRFTLIVDVRPGNDPPFVVGAPADQELIEGIEFSLPLSAFFVDIDDGDTLRFSALGLPGSNSLSINALSGVMSGTPIRADARETPYDVVVVATDSGGASASLNFRMTIFPEDRADMSLSAVVVANPVTVGESVQWQIAVENKGPADLDTGELSLRWATSGPALSLSAPQSCVVQNNATSAPTATCILDGMRAETGLTIDVQGTQTEDGDNTLIAVVIADDPKPQDNAASVASQVIAEFSEGPTQILDRSGADIGSGDLNGDGEIDVVTVSDETLVFFNNGNRALTTPGMSLGAESGGSFVALLDWNGDGALDIAIGGLASLAAEIFLNDGKGEFSSAVRMQDDAVGEVNGIAAVDLDLDGNAELILTGSSDTIIMRRSGPGEFDLLLPPVGAGIDATVADLNLDGYADIIVVELADRAVAVMLNSGIGNTFETTRLLFGNVARVSAADLNNDGNADLLLTIDGSELAMPENLILYQQGNGDFTLGGTFGASVVSELLAGDVDDDGWSDILAINEAGVHQLYRGSSDGEFVLNAEQIVSAGMRQGVLVDFNGDQSIDLILAGDEVVEIHANNGVGRLGLGDRMPPEITLQGEAVVTIAAGSPYDDAGATASDDIDGDITDSIVQSGNVNSTVVGTYPISYTSTDRAGNSSSVQRTVTVKVNDGVGGGGGGATGLLQTLSLLLLISAFLYGRFRRRRAIV